MRVRRGSARLREQRFGLTIANVIAADVALARSAFLTVSQCAPIVTCSGRCAVTAATSAWSLHSRSPRWWSLGGHVAGLC